MDLVTAEANHVAPPSRPQTAEHLRVRLSMDAGGPRDLDVTDIEAAYFEAGDGLSRAGGRSRSGGPPSVYATGGTEGTHAPTEAGVVVKVRRGIAVSGRLTSANRTGLRCPRPGSFGRTGVATAGPAVDLTSRLISNRPRATRSASKACPDPKFAPRDSLFSVETSPGTGRWRRAFGRVVTQDRGSSAAESSRIWPLGRARRSPRSAPRVTAWSASPQVASDGGQGNEQERSATRTRP